MGLDMFLYKAENEKALEDFYQLDYEQWQVERPKFMAGQWRKANAIHAWFVDNCQNGVDECQLTQVSGIQLQKLIGICEQVLEDNSKAASLLPPRSGFFFGSYKIDEWYIRDIEYTIEACTAGLEAIQEGKKVYYQSSW